MPHFLIKNEEINNDFIELKDNDNFIHITKALRAKIGEIIKFIDNNKTVYEAKIIEITKQKLSAQIIKQYKSLRTLDFDIVLIQSILANDAQNILIANATQTGASKIYPILTDNSSISASQTKNKVEKWQRIAYENFKQCERADIPTILEVTNLKESLKLFKKENIIIYAEKYENCSIDDALKDIKKDEPIAVVIGPEGGFSKQEFEYFKKENYKLVTLGRLIYKAPNAVVAGISNIISRLENYDI